jgi:hypothetical protein
MFLTPFNFGGVPLPGGGRTLPFIMQRQEQTQWCWAATSISVSRYFNSSSRWTQCTMVNQSFNMTDCCVNGSSPGCNQPWFLDEALRISRNFHDIEPRRAGLPETTAEIDADRPLCLRIGWNTGGGHFVAIYGYSGTMINIGDPWWGNSAIDFNNFPEQYQTGGNWTHTYWVVA